MPIDINLLRPDRGGDPEKVKASQRARFDDEAIVDQIMALDAQQRTGKYCLENFCERWRVKLFPLIVD